MDLKLLVPEEEHVSGRITYKSNLNVIGAIKCALSNDDLLLFERSCFGRYMEMIGSLKTGSQVLHILNCRRIKNPTNKNELWFDIFGRPARFSVVEFAMITGLKCGEIPDLPRELLENNTLKDKYFNKEGKITVAKLLAKFQRMDSGIDKVKMALVLFLNDALLGNESKLSIRMDSLSLVNHLDEFNAYPWGQLSYEMTIKSYGKNMKRDGLEYQYTLIGFPWAIQVWAFEMFDSIAGLYGIHAEERKFPRILNWSSQSKNTQFLDVVRALRLEKEFDTTLRVVGEELEELYMQHVDYSEDDESWQRFFIAKKRKKGKKDIDIGNDDGRSSGKPVETRTQTKDQKGKNKEEKRGEGYQPQYVTYDQMIDMEKRLKSHIDEGISRSAKTAVDTIWKKIDSKIDRFLKSFTGRHSPSKEELRKLARNPKKKLEEGVTGFEEGVTEFEEGVTEFEEGLTDCVNIVSPEKTKAGVATEVFNIVSPEKPKKGGRLRVKSKFVISPFLAESSTQEEIIYTDFDPLRPLNETMFKRLKKLCAERDNKQVIKCRIGEYGRKFFRSLLTAKFWLTDEMIDEGLAGIRIRNHAYPTIFPQDVAIMDCYFSQMLSIYGHRYLSEGFDADNLKEEKIFTYISGEAYENPEGRPWNECRFIYVPINLNKNHWVMAVFELATGHCTILDSVISSNENEGQFYELIKHYLAFFPRLMRSSGRMCHLGGVLERDFTYTRLQDIPQNIGGDYGVYIIKHVELHMMNLNFNLVTDDNIKFVRDKLACDIYQGRFFP